MTHCVLFLAAQLGGRPAEGVASDSGRCTRLARPLLLARQEDRVIPEPAGAARDRCNPPLPGALAEDRCGVIGARYMSDDASIARGALLRRHAAQLRQQFLEVLPVRRAFAGVTR